MVRTVDSRYDQNYCYSGLISRRARGALRSSELDAAPLDGLLEKDRRRHQPGLT